jgi:hypothetical protein
LNRRRARTILAPVSTSTTSRGAVVALLAPFAALAAVVGYRASCGERDEERAGLAAPFFTLGLELDARASPPRVLVYSRIAPALRVHDADGRGRGTLRARGVAEVRWPPLFDADRRVVAYLGGGRESPVHDVHVGLLPAGRDAPMRSYRLRSPAILRPRDAATAFACGAEIRLQVVDGWALLPLEGPPQPRRRPSFADTTPSPPPPGCAPLAGAYGARPQRIPIEHALYAELERQGRPHVLGAARVPPRSLVLVPPDRRGVRSLHPSRRFAVGGSVLRHGRHLLFFGRECEVGELRLALADIEDPAWRPGLWERVLPMTPFAGCRPDLAPAARVCRRTIALRVGAREHRLRLSDGAAAASDDDRERCDAMRELRRDAAPWEAGRTLEHDGERFRVEPAAHGHALVTSRWRVQLARPAFILGATADAILLVDGAELEARERASGSLRARLRVPALHHLAERRPASCRWAGHVGRRGYFAVEGEAGDRAFVFDGDRVRALE